MAIRLNRRFTALTTAMLFALSVATHGLAASHVRMNATAMATSDMPTDPDSGCGGDGMGLACFALCASAVAILPDLASLPIVIAAERPVSTPERSVPSRNSPPDPAPPRPVVLS
jgi:hypothetical protein